MLPSTKPTRDERAFDYETAFRRNLGFTSPDEQQRLRRSRVALAGLGGTGGAQLHALTRIGIGAFNIADPDTFEPVNFNRQIGAFTDTVGRKKTEVMAELARAINPEVDVRRFDAGISASNLDAFLDDADVVVDSLDFYCFSERFKLYARARERGLWVLTAPPLGFGFTMLLFDPKGMRFEDYFGFDEHMDERELVVALVAGITPAPYLLRYLDRRAISLGGRQLPSVGAAPFMIAGAMTAEVTNLLIGKVPPRPVPTIYQFDALLRRFRQRTYRRGMRSPLQELKKRVLRKRLAA